MSQEDLQTITEPTETTTPNVESTSTQVEIDPYESEAREQGWKPKEDYDGDPSKWRPAKEFVERGELFGKIDILGRELKETKKALKLLQEHNSKIKEVEYKRAVDELKALQKRHLEEGNSDGYLETTELLTDLKAEQKAREVISTQVPNQDQSQIDPRFTAWVDQNKWYTKDPELRQYADVVGMGYAKANPDLNPEDVLKFVAREVKARYKDRFVNPNRSNPSPVEGAGSGSGSKKESFTLTEDERRTMNSFVRTGALTADEYIAQVKALRGVK